MDNDPATIRKLLHQQAAIAGFGSFALRQNDLMKILTEAARVCANGLNVPFSKICRYRDVENDLLIEAGYGWKEGVVGKVVSHADGSSPQGRAFITGQPSICNNLRDENDFELPPFYAEHGIFSTIDVLIKGQDKPYGVLEIDNDMQHDYDQHDINFLTGFANVLAEAVATSARTTALRIANEEKDRLLAEKDRLLGQNKVLAEELQHRVRNNLQLVYSMLRKQLSDTRDEAGQRGIKAITRRVSAIAQVYDHLLGKELNRISDFGAYVKSLCHNLADIQGSPDREVTLSCERDSLLLDLDTVTALGIVLTELVTNSYDHAFPDGKGATTVSVRRSVGNDNKATMIISDNGKGFVAKADSKRHGLGLVRRLIQQIHGTATVGSDNGTVWTIRFPVAERSRSIEEVSSQFANA